MMAPCWWAHGPNFWAPSPGAPCWWGCSDTSTGATRTLVIARHRHCIPGIMKNGCRHCITWVAWMDEDEHPDPGGGLEVACVDALRCWRTKDNHRPQTTSPHTPLRCPHGATLLPCATTRCYCGTTMPHDAPTTPKVASAVNVPPPPC